MAEVIHIQRVTIHLKNGTNLAIDLKAEESQQINPQIAAFQGIPRESFYFSGHSGL